MLKIVSFLSSGWRKLNKACQSSLRKYLCHGEQDELFQSLVGFGLILICFILGAVLEAVEKHYLY